MLDSVVIRLSSVIPVNIKEIATGLAIGFLFLCIAYSTVDSGTRHRSDPPSYHYREPEYPDEFEVNIKSLHHNPYIKSIKDKFKDDYQNHERAHHLAMLDVFYSDLKYVLPPDVVNPEHMELFKELLTLDINNDLKRIYQIYDIVFYKYSNGIGVNDKFRNEMRERVKFGLDNRDFHAIHGLLRLGIGDLARYGYLIGGDNTEITLTEIGFNHREYEFKRLRGSTSGVSRIRFDRDENTNAYKSSYPPDMPVVIIEAFSKWEMENVINRLTIPDSTKRLENVNIVQYFFPIVKNCYGVRFDIYGHSETIKNTYDTADYSIKIVVSDLEKILFSDSLESKVYIPDKGPGFHLGFNREIYCLNQTRSDSVTISVGCEFRNKENNKVARDKDTYTLFNSDVPHYSAQLRHQNQSDSTLPIPNIALPTKVDKTAKFIIPVTGAKPNPDSTKYSGNINIYLIDIHNTINVKDTAHYSNIQFHELNDSAFTVMQKGMTSMKGSTVYLGRYPFNFSNPDGYAKIDVPMTYVNSMKKEKEVSKGTYKALIFVTSGPDDRVINTVSMDRFVKK